MVVLFYPRLGGSRSLLYLSIVPGFFFRYKTISQTIFAIGAFSFPKSSWAADAPLSDTGVFARRRSSQVASSPLGLGGFVARVYIPY